GCFRIEAKTRKRHRHFRHRQNFKNPALIECRYNGAHDHLLVGRRSAEPRKVSVARQSLALPKYLPSYNGGNRAGTLANAFGAALQFGARTIQRRRLTEWQRGICAGSAKGPGGTW